MPPSSPNYKRKYAQEKKTSDARGEKPKRAQRNRARLKLKKAGVDVKGKDVDHKKGTGAGNGRKNLRAISKKANRSYKRTKTAGKK